MPICVEICPPILTRLCHFCLSLQGGSVLCDFEVEADGRVVLRRISFDGFGCCDAPDDIGKMNLEDSRILIDAINRSRVDEAGVPLALCRYFQQIKGQVWSDALAEHGLIGE